MEARVNVGEIDKALIVFDKMSIVPTVVTYNIILRSLCDKGKLKEYHTLLTALCKDGKVDFAIEIFNHLSFEGCSPVLITYNTVINGLSKIGKIGQVIMLIDKMNQKGL
ncbi:hypothetical protein L6452_20893 [Arctium lappa]|uniref:Uncharacterized protein n=1 Tax=Arctium lappa TaxID=4217 RepID=A0ACB9BDX8_ARCLA|nr:hypothetical protein L6452_20893 [Arctium lappa]